MSTNGKTCGAFNYYIDLIVVNVTQYSTYNGKMSGGGNGVLVLVSLCATNLMNNQQFTEKLLYVGDVP